jgi:hypothetical protein
VAFAFGRNMLEYEDDYFFEEDKILNLLQLRF